MIPAFLPEEVWPETEEVPYKVLPPGIFIVDRADIKQRFVVPYLSSKTRRYNYKGMLRLMDEAATYWSLNLTHWVGGSFIADKCDPGDIDVVTIVDGEFLDEAPWGCQQFMSSHFDGKSKTQKTYSCDTLLAIVYPPGHPRHELGEKIKKQYRKHLGFTRIQKDPNCPEDMSKRLPRAPRGIVQLQTGQADLCPYVEECLEEIEG